MPFSPAFWCARSVFFLFFEPRTIGRSCVCGPYKIRCVLLGTPLMFLPIPGLDDRGCRDTCCVHIKSISLDCYTWTITNLLLRAAGTPLMFLPSCFKAQAGRDDRGCRDACCVNIKSIS